MGDLNRYVSSVKNLYKVKSFDELLTGSVNNGSGITDILYLFQNEASGNDFTSKLEGLNSKDISEFSWVLDVFKIKMNGSNTTTDYAFFENAIASLAVSGLWENLIKSHGVEKIEEKLKEDSSLTDFKLSPLLEKEFNSGDLKENSVFYTANNIVVLTLNSLKEKNLLSYEFADTQNADFIAEYDKLLKLSELLHKKIIVPMRVEKVLNALLERLEVFYKPLWGEKFFGFLYKDVESCGITPKADKIKQLEKQGSYMDMGILNALFSAWVESQNISLPDMCPLTDTSLHLYKSSIPGFHTNILKNQKNVVWSAVSRKIKDFYATKLLEIDKSSKDNSSFQKEVNVLMQNLLSNFVITDWSKHTIQIRISGIANVENLQNSLSTKLYELFGSAANFILKNIKLSDNSEKSGIFNISYIYDQRAFDNETLFAYKIYEENPGYKPSLDNTVIGQNMDGTLLTIDLTEESSKSIFISAGSRSGKGVMTMSLMASAMGAGSSLIYLDHKPDIAAMLWQLEGKFKDNLDKDVRFLALDTVKDNCDFNGFASPRSYDFTIPYGNLGLTKETMRFIRTLKTFQMLDKLGDYGSMGGDVKNGCTFVVVDELTVLSDLEVKFKEELKAAEKIASTLKDKHPEYKEYVLSIKKLYADAKASINSGVNAKWAISGIRLILIGQELNEKWNPNADFVISLLSTVKRTIAGRLQVALNRTEDKDTGKVEITKVNYSLSESEAKLADKRGVFALHSGKPYGLKGCKLGSKGIPVGNGETNMVTNFTQFRSYFTLVDNDLNVDNLPESDDATALKTYFMANKTKYTSELLNSSVGTPRYNEMLNELRDVDSGVLDRVSFYGLINLIRERTGMDLDTFVENLNAGYSNMETLFNGLHLNTKYKCVEEYLVDCSPESFFNNDALDSLLGKKVSTDASLDLDALLKEQNPEKENELRLLKEKQLQEIETIKSSITQLVLSAVKSLSKEKEEVLFNQKKNLEISKCDAAYLSKFDNILQQISDKSFETDCKADISNFLNDNKQTLQKLEFGLALSDESFENKTQDTENLEPVPSISEEDKIQAKLQKLYDKYDIKYNSSLKVCENDIITLKNIPYADKNIPKYNGLKTKILNNIGGYYREKELSFFNDLNKEIVESQVKNMAIDHYKKLYENYWSTTKETVSQMELSESDVGDLSDNEITLPSDSFIPDKSTNTSIPEKEDKPIKQKSVNDFNAIKVESSIDTKDLKYNVTKTDEMGNVKASNQLTQQVIKDIKGQFGGVNNINTIAINANECLVIEGHTYSPRFSETFMNSLGMAVRDDVESGKIGKVVNLGKVIHSIMGNIMELTIETPKIAYNNLFKNEMGVTKGYDKLFKVCPNLNTINLPDNELTRENPKGKAISSGLGLGSKLSKIFGFGLGKGDKGSQKSLPNPSVTHDNNGLVDRFFDSRPVRICTGAFGWTMGCKAVVMAATLFGPWGLLFGALAMAGTYNELKGNKNDTRNESSGQRKDIQRTNSSKPRNRQNRE